MERPGAQVRKGWRGVEGDGWEGGGEWRRRGHLDRFACAQIPQADDGVEAGGRDQRPVGVEADRIQRPRVALLQQQLAARLDIPQAPGGVEGGGANEAARRVEADAAEPTDVAAELAELLASLE